MAETAHTVANMPSADGVVKVTNPSGDGDFVIVCEHASNFIPPELDNLGLSKDVLNSHVSWDPGALQVAQAMSAELDAPLVASQVSRVVFDCNRHPGAQSAVPLKSENFEIPGNAGLFPTALQARAEQFYVPFRDALSAMIVGRMEARRAPVILTVHSFNPVYEGIRRDLDIGIIHDEDTRFADEVLKITDTQTEFTVRRNAPYGPGDGVTHTLVEHAIQHGLLNVMIEIRNDLVANPAGQRARAKWQSSLVTKALAVLGNSLNGSREMPPGRYRFDFTSG